jgi:hypothetical protein
MTVGFRSVSRPPPLCAGAKRRVKSSAIMAKTMSSVIFRLTQCILSWLVKGPTSELWTLNDNTFDPDATIFDMEHYLHIRDFVKMGKKVLYVKYRLRIRWSSSRRVLRASRFCPLIRFKAPFFPSRQAARRMFNCRNLATCHFLYETGGKCLPTARTRSIWNRAPAFGLLRLCHFP